MKTNQYKSGTFAHFSSAEYYEKLTELTTIAKPFPCFEFEGRYFSGDAVSTAKQYLMENPSKKYLIWLVDNGLEIQNIN